MEALVFSEIRRKLHAIVVLPSFYISPFYALQQIYMLQYLLKLKVRSTCWQPRNTHNMDEYRKRCGIYIVFQYIIWM